MIQLITITLIILALIFFVFFKDLIYDKRKVPKDIQFAVGIIIILLITIWLISPVLIKTYDIAPKSKTITIQKTTINQYVISDSDTLLVSQKSKIDTISTGILPDSLHLKKSAECTLLGVKSNVKIEK